MIVLGLEHLTSAQYMPESAKLRTSDANVSSRCKFAEVEKVWDREHAKESTVWSCVHSHSCDGSGLKTEGLLGCMFWYILKLQDTLQTRTAHELERLHNWMVATDSINSVTTGVHFRAGDKTVLFEASEDVRVMLDDLDKQTYCASRVVQLLSITVPPTVLLCTDSMEAKAHATTKYKSVLASKTVPVHVDKTEQSSTSLEGTIGSWVDIFMLATVDGTGSV